MYSAAVNAHIRELIELAMEYRDQGQWEKLERLFTETPYVNEEALNNEEAGVRAIANVTYGWRRMIRDLYYSVRHNLGNITVERTGKKNVRAETEVEARYYTMKNGQREVVKYSGTYHYEFRKVAGRWKIDSLRFDLHDQSISLVGA